MAVSKSHCDRVAEGIAAHLPDLYAEQWAQKAADLRDIIDRTTGAEQEEAKEALRMHYKAQFLPDAAGLASFKRCRAL